MNENGFTEGFAVGQGMANNNCCMPYGGGFGGLGGWGGDWLAIIVLAALFGGGFGYGGFGGFGGAGGGVFGEVQRGFDTQGINNKLNGIENGLCDGFYAQNTNTLNGFSGVQNALCQGFSGVNATINQVGNSINQGICNLGYNVQGGFNEVAHQIGDCCCQTQRAIDGVNYNLATQSCETRRAIEDSTNRVLGFLTDQKIDSLRAENAALTAQLSNNAQTERIISRLAPCPIPAYPACPPAGAYNWNAWGAGNTNACSCGC